MKRTASSVLSERRKQRRAVTPTPISVRHVKFSPEEMEHDMPDGGSRFVPVGRGPRAHFARPVKAAEAGTVVRLEADVAKVFKNGEAVNRALRKLIEAMPPAGARRRSA